MGKNVGRAKVSQAVGWDNLRVKAKLHAQAKQDKEFTRHFPSVGRGLALSRKAGLHEVEQWLGKTNAIMLPVFPFLLLPPALTAATASGTGLWSVWFSSPGCVPCRLVLPYTWDRKEGAARETEVALTLCKRCSSSAKTWMCLKFGHKSKAQPVTTC